MKRGGIPWTLWISSRTCPSSSRYMALLCTTRLRQSVTNNFVLTFLWLFPPPFLLPFRHPHYSFLDSFQDLRGHASTLSMYSPFTLNTGTSLLMLLKLKAKRNPAYNFNVNVNGIGSGQCNAAGNVPPPVPVSKSRSEKLVTGTWWLERCSK